MMHVQFNEAWHGKVHKQYYKLSGAQHATPLHIDETPHSSYLVRSCLCTPTILNVVKHGKRVKQSKTTYLVKFKWGQNNKTTSPETPHVHILVMVLFCPNPYFIVVKHANWCHHVKLGIFPPHLHIKFVRNGATVI